MNSAHSDSISDESLGEKIYCPNIWSRGLDLEMHQRDQNLKSTHALIHSCIHHLTSNICPLTPFPSVNNEWSIRHSWQNEVIGLKIHYPRSFIRFDIPKSMVLRVSIHKNHNGGCFWENFILSKCWKISYFEPMMCICHHFKAKSHFKDPLLN